MDTAKVFNRCMMNSPRSMPSISLFDRAAVNFKLSQIGHADVGRSRIVAIARWFILSFHDNPLSFDDTCGN
jgi:hypothetical protein